MNLLQRFRVVPFLFFYRNGKGEQAVIPVQEPQEAVVETKPILSSKDAPAIPIESDMVDLREFIRQERGVENAKVRSTVDSEGLVRLNIGILPRDDYKKDTNLKKLGRRVRNDVSLRTKIPRSRINVKRNLKIPPPADGSPKGPSPF